MKNLFKVILIIVLLTVVGCSNAMNEKDEEPTEIKTVTSYFTGTVKEINGNSALVSATLGGGKGDVVVDLSVNKDESFQVADQIKVGYDGTIMESNPAQINTLSVEWID